MSIDMKYFEEMEAKIPHGKVRTRFAPSPTGYMHVGNLRTARYAYLLARLSPKKSAPDYPLYEQFSHSMMDWALDAVQRHQLITAIYIYVYQNRKGGDTDGRME